MGAILAYLRHTWVKKVPASAEVLREALNHPEPEVARLALAGVGELLRADPTQLSDRLREQAATAAWSVITALDSAANFNAPGWIADLDAAQQRAVLDIVFAIDDIWPFNIDQIVAAIAHYRPADVLHRLADRHKDRLPPLRDYQNLPAALSGHAAAIGDWIVESAQVDDVSAFYLHRLFPLIAGDPITADAIQAITIIASRSDARELTFLSGGLSNCSGFALNHPETVATLLEAFRRLRFEDRQKCRALLQNSTAPAGYWNAASELGNIRDRAAALAENGSFPSELQGFYSEVAIHWQALIDRESEIPPESQ
jgi:hypothetical protein